MREIKFRAKGTEQQKWIFGMVTLIDENKKYCLIRPNGSNTSYECELETLGQYTGLKDKNRKGSKFCRL